MEIGNPAQSQIHQLLALWEDAFGVYNGFWRMFLSTGFSPERCLCIHQNGQFTAALTWFDCSIRDQKTAYVYAVVTHPAHRGRGLCRKLLQHTHVHLSKLGYSSVLLVPAQEPLRRMYETMGYRTCTAVSEFACGAEEIPLSPRAIGPREYAALRRRFLPPGSILQEGENLDFLAQQAQFYAGDDFLLAAYCDNGVLHGMELLGSRRAAPGIVNALGCREGRFRSPGRDIPFAMICPLAETAVIPDYFGFAFD